MKNALDIFKLFFASKIAEELNYHEAWGPIFDKFELYLEKTDEDGRTVLYYAIYQNNVDLVQFLIDRGANIEAVDDVGRTLLHCAAYFNFADIVELLVSVGANLSAKDNLGRTPLHQAVCGASIGVVQYLLSQGVDVNVVDNERNTPLNLIPSDQVAVYDSTELLTASKCYLNGIEPIESTLVQNRSADINKINELLTIS